MRYTAIALDYDGTIAHDGGVPPHVIEGLRKLRASGRKTLLVTGRELEELLGIFPEIDVFDRVVAENGALLYRPDTGERRELGEPPPACLIEALKASGIPLAVGHTILATIRPHETVVLECIANQGLEQQVIFNKGAVMVLPPGCNKASGLKHALAELGLSPRNVVAGGDGENDHAMLDLAEYSVATANAIPTLKDAADRVTTKTHGDGMMEIIQGLLDSDLSELPPKRRRRALSLGHDSEGVELIFPSRRTSLLVAGEPRETMELSHAIFERLCKAGYQTCVIDTRGDYLGLDSAVAFGTLDNPPAVDEVLTALVKPDVQTVICMAAIPRAERPAFIERLRVPLRKLRASTGRPHWIIADEASELLPAGHRRDDSPGDGAENVIFVTQDPTALAPSVLAAVDGIAACGERAGATLDALAAALSWGKPALPARLAAAHEALVWFRKSERPVALVDIARAKADPEPAKTAQRREKSPEVGQVLRRA